MSRELHDESTTFDIKESELSEVVNADGDVVYTVRPLSTAKFREFQRKNTRLVPNKASKQMESEVNGDNLTDDLIDFVIVNWVGIVDKGQPADCTRANKLRLDGQVKSGLIGVAGLNRINAAPAETERSFRPAS